MKATFLICCSLACALIVLSCAPEGTLGLSVTEIDDGVVIENTGTTGCIATVTSPEGGQQFELAVGENVTVTNISQPIEISAVSLATS
jgi:hypothetical protein